MEKNWSNDYIDLKAEINNLGIIPNSSPLEVKYKVNNEEIKTFKIKNNDYPIVSYDNKTGEMKIDENILANKILTDLYENNEIAPAFLSGESGKYLVEAAKDKNFYYEDNYVYDLYGLKAFREKHLADYIDKLDDEYVKEVNKTLLRVLEEMNVYDSHILAHNDLHFEPTDKEDKDFGKAKPVYRCERRKVSGLIKHVKNSLAKHNILEITNSKDFMNILKRKTKDNFSWETMRDGSFYKVMRNDNSISFDILIEGDNILLFDNNKDEKDFKKFRLGQMEELIEYLNK